jgi:hypothetical protein
MLSSIYATISIQIIKQRKMQQMAIIKSNNNIVLLNKFKKFSIEST